MVPLVAERGICCQCVGSRAQELRADCTAHDFFENFPTLGKIADRRIAIAHLSPRDAPAWCPVSGPVRRLQCARPSDICLMRLRVSAGLLAGRCVALSARNAVQSVVSIPQSSGTAQAYAFEVSGSVSVWRAFVPNSLRTDAPLSAMGTPMRG